MASKSKAPRGHTGATGGGNTRYVKIDRIGKVSLYKRGKTYSVYYRENNRSIRQPVDGNLTVARATASKINAQLEEGQRSLFSFQRVTPKRFVEEFLAYTRDVQQLAWRTVERYRAALERFVDFAGADGNIATIDQVEAATIQDFVAWLRGRLRARNGAAGGTRAHYRASGIRFILSACRTAFNWARKRRYLPPYADSPFMGYPIEKIRDRDEDQRKRLMLDPEDLTKFLEACDEWQRPIFEVLVTYGLRIGELTHVLVDDMDFEKGVLHIRSKPELSWYVKTSRDRTLPILEGIDATLRRLIGERKAGFVFLDRPFATGERNATVRAKSPAALKEYFERELDVARDGGPSEDKALARHMENVARMLGKISEKRVRQEFIALTKAIGRDDLTRVHSLRHVFSTRAQEAGTNPLLVQQILGHSTLEMTNTYTHLGIEAQRQALEGLIPTAAKARRRTITKKNRTR